jgi:murein DD-endopeptidase MepM/ murein hydrolase activator NlpD
MTYKVKAGDNLSKVAKRYGISLAQLLKANPQIKNPDRIQVGQLINLPDTSTDTTQPLPSNDVPATQPTPKPEPATTTDTPASPVAAAAGALGAALAEALGALSAKYETGGRGPGTVSTGAGDRGGVSYGSYQMASKLGVATRFVKQNSFPWLADFQNLTAGTAEFTACWKRIAKNEPDAFQKAQHEFIKKTHYDLLVAKIISDDDLDVNSRCHALKDVVWSTAVQHGGASSIVHKALAKVKCAKTDPSFDEQLIRAIYAERGRTKADGSLVYFSRNSPNVQKGVANRFKNELNDALAMLAKDVK